eukprot:CAMPEP_0176471314 /NCGR_PEP_ID=MMETSP0127-20121128/41062_1 /TAXON_ID=938130 /ORGANISM="Platyophrya macrostoma, Strain WH" /LENGTH=250 /DNA_ID=CAMNT_0017865945 /DNA_START=172 /DNA_END=924 /DNA_ORIENTATION=-
MKTQGCFVTIHIAKRPGLKAFLKKMSKYYQLALYTSSIREYAYAVLNSLRIRKFFAAVLHREHCERVDGGKLEKRLSIIKKAPADIILVDDSVFHRNNQPDNIFNIKEFRGDMDDNELSNVTNFLKAMSKVPDVRSVEKKFEEFQKNPVLGESITTNGLGERTYKTKLIQLLNDQYRHKTREVEYDQTSFEDIDEGITDENEQKISVVNMSKQLCFELAKSDSMKCVETPQETSPLALRANYREVCQTCP